MDSNEVFFVCDVSITFVALLGFVYSQFGGCCCLDFPSVCWSPLCVFFDVLGSRRVALLLVVHGSFFFSFGFLDPFRLFAFA